MRTRNRLDGSGRRGQVFGGEAVPDLLADLLAYWKLDGDGADSSGNALDLTVAGTYNTGHLGQALATGDASFAGMGVGRTYTVAGWAKLVTEDLDGTAGSISVQRGNNTEIASVRITSGSGLVVVGVGTAILPGVWHHFALAVSGGVATVYVDGVMVGTDTVPNDVFMNITIYTEAVGNSWWDEVGVWQSVLSAAAVARLYNGGAGRTHPFA
jgi:hypothetical protein